MRFKLSSLFLSLFFTTSLFAQLPQNCATSERLLMVGDSWAQYMFDDGVHNEVMDAYGHADKKIRSESFEIALFSGDPDPQGSYYAVSGSEARQWRDEGTYAFLQNVRNELVANPQITLVIFSLGGNDVLAGQSDCGWYKNMDMDTGLPGRGCGFSDENSFFDKLEADITWILNEVLAVRPDIEVLISSYDYPNFNVTTSWGGCFWCNLCDFYACPKREDLSFDVNGDGSITGSELVTDAELNQMMMMVEARRQAIANANPRIYFDNSMGLTHHIYGYDDGLYSDILPGNTPYPGGPPAYTPGGNPNVPSDRDNFRLVDVPLWFDAPADPIHLTSGAYTYKAKNQMDRVIFDHIRGLRDEPHAMTFWSEGNLDGYVDILENNAYNNGLRMGDEDTGWVDLDNDYRAILSFDTGALPDNALVTGASLYLIRSSEEDNPFLHSDRNPVMDIKSGHFGNSNNLEVADGTSAADAVNAGCFIGKAAANKRAIRVDVDSDALGYVNLTGRTQFRLYFDYADWSDEYINFYDGAGIPALAPASEMEKNSQPVFKNIIRKKTPLADGTYKEEIVEQNTELQRREGYVFEERLVSSVEDDDGTITQTFLTLTAVEHSGLARYMSQYQGAPANGYAPFLDVSYIITLPLDLTQFKARKINKNAELSWTTAHESNSLGFEIQHSTNSTDWTKIGWLDCQRNGATASNYTFIHKEPGAGVNYYRLKIIEQSGDFTYSEVKDLYFDFTGDPIVVFPNPFDQELKLQFNFATSEQVNIDLINVLGAVVYHRSRNVVGGQNSVSIETSDLAGGTYFLRIGTREMVWSFKVVKE